MDDLNIGWTQEGQSNAVEQVGSSIEGVEKERYVIAHRIDAVPTKTQLSNFLGTPGEDYFKGNPKSLNFYFLVIWWGKDVSGQIIATLAEVTPNDGFVRESAPKCPDHSGLGI